MVKGVTAVNKQLSLSLIAGALVAVSSGCHSLHQASGRHTLKENPPTIRPAMTPRELCKATLPDYRVEPPDILDIEAVRLVPKASYQLNSSDVVRVKVQRTSFDQLVRGDIVAIRVPGAPAVSPIDGTFVIQANGTVSFGSPYGSVKIEGLSLEEAKKALEAALAETLVAPDTFIALVEAGLPVDEEFAIEIDGTIDFGHPYGQVTLEGYTISEARNILLEHFSRTFDNPSVTLNLIQPSLLQQILGEHLVGPDGKVTLGIYGSVSVVGLTLEEANLAIEQKLADVLDDPKVATSVLSYNSKVYYVIAEGAGFGEGVYRFPVTGNDTVLDALSQIQGLPQGSSTKMWIARPTPVAGQYQVMPVDWRELTSLAATDTNYQLLPGDRLFITRDPLVAFNSNLAKLLDPIERIFGFSILGAETITRFSGDVLKGGGNPLGRF
jgi:polysaccharide export outer membrane protein